MINRRQWLYGAGALAAAGTGIANAAAPVTEEKAKPAPQADDVKTHATA